MTRIENVQDIRQIVMKPEAHTKCVIGGDWYSNKLEITMTPGEYYPDYMEVQNWIMENIDGKSLNIEDVVNMVYQKIDKEFEPEFLEVTNNITGCKTHFDVIVVK